MKNVSSKIAAIIAFFLLLNQTASADIFDWTSTDLQFLYGRDFKLGDPIRTTTTVEHSDGWKYGSNYFFVDIMNRNDIGTEVYGEVYSYLSFKKISGLDIAVGPLKDISLMGGLNIGNKPEHDHTKAYLVGLNFDWTVPFFDYFKTSISMFKHDAISGKYGMQITPVWSVPFEIAGVKFKFRGFTDFNFGYTNAKKVFSILSQPQLLLDVGDLAGFKSNTVYVGTEYYHWTNKYGNKGVDEHVVQAMIIGFF